MNINNTVSQLVANYAVCESSEVNMNATFNELGLDSLDMIELIMDVEDEWDIHIPDEFSSNFKTPMCIVNYLIIKVV